MKTYSICTSLLLMFVISTVVVAQQEILYTQYVYNELTINPAYAGYHEDLNVSLNSRKQWTGLEGSPLTTTLAGHLSLKDKNPESHSFKSDKRGALKPAKTNNRVGLGFLFYNDRIGVDNTNQASFSYSYKISFKQSRLSFGLQVSLLKYSQNFNSLDNFNKEDPVFSENFSKFLVNFGTGIFFDSEKYYFGLSVPAIIKNSLNNDNFGNTIQLRQYFATGGYMFYLNRSLKFKPSFMFRYTEGTPFQIDFNSMFIFNDKFHLGLSYRNKNVFSTIVQMAFDDRIRIGLAYDFDFLNELGKATNGSVEVLIYYNFRSPNHRIVSPRYF